MLLRMTGDGKLWEATQTLMRWLARRRQLKRGCGRHLIRVDRLLLKIQELPNVVLWISCLEVSQCSFLKIL